MEQDYTSIQLIQFIYGECDLFERLEIEDALHHNATLRAEFNELYSSYKSMPKVKFSPSSGTLKNILGFANTEMSATA